MAERKKNSSNNAVNPDFAHFREFDEAEASNSPHQSSKLTASPPGGSHTDASSSDGSLTDASSSDGNQRNLSSADGSLTDVSSSDGSQRNESSEGFFDSPSDIPDDFDERNSSGLIEDDVSEVSDPFIDADNVEAEALPLHQSASVKADSLSSEEEPVEIFIPALDDFDVSDEVICINMKEFVIPKNKSVTVPRYVRDYYYTLCKQKADFTCKRNALAAPKD